MPSLYRDEFSNPTANAQRNLMGRTHYVDPETLRWHKSRVLASHAVDGGLLFAIIESCALDMHNTRRGFRYVVFDLFGKVVSRVDLEDCFASKKAAEKAMWAYLDTVAAAPLTLEAIEREERNRRPEMDELRDKLTARAAA